MERFVLRVLVLVLLGTSLGFWGMAHSKVMLHAQSGPITFYHPKPPEPFPPGDSGPTGTTGPTAPTGDAKAPPVQPEPAAKPDVAFLTLEQAKKIYDDKQVDGKDVIFVDAREYIEYIEGHVAGAMSCPKRRFDGAVPPYVRNYLPGNAVVVYCHGELCTDSEAVVKRLKALNLGIGPYYIIKDGYPGWEKAKYPIAKGDMEGFAN